MRSIRKLGEEICTLTGHLNAATHRWLMLIAECRFPGCANARYIDAHHILHWANGGETKPSNLLSLCRFHHRAVHEGGIRIERLDDGALRFVRQEGDAIDAGTTSHQPPGDPTQMPTGTQVNNWRGERMDLGLAVDILVQLSKHVKHVPAGTSPG
jgi:hypothetical protein